MKLFFYGTLRKGGIFSMGLPKDRKITLCQIQGIRMYMLGQYPGVQVTDNEEDYVVGEMVDFDGIISNDEWERLLERMDCIEGVDFGLFERSVIETPYGEVIIYLVTNKTLGLFKKAYDKYPAVLNDWAAVDPDVADMVETLNKEKDNVTVRTTEQKD